MLMRKGLWITGLVLALLIAGCANDGWRTASREPSGIAPSPEDTREAVIQVFGAPAYGWRGWFAIHTWIAMKPANGSSYTVYEVIGWRARHGLPVLRIAQDYPDRYWFGERPKLLLDRRGEGVEQMIREVDQAARNYPWANEYKVFPGPNSNTFPAWISKQVPELGLELPFSAIGKNYAD